jgi:hypothetical protein
VGSIFGTLARAGPVARLLTVSQRERSPSGEIPVNWNGACASSVSTAFEVEVGEESKAIDQFDLADLSLRTTMLRILSWYVASNCDTGLSKTNSL